MLTRIVLDSSPGERDVCQIIQLFLECFYEGQGKSVLYDQPTHVGRESVDCRPLVVRLLVVSRPSVGR